MLFAAASRRSSSRGDGTNWTLTKPAAAKADAAAVGLFDRPAYRNGADEIDRFRNSRRHGRPEAMYGLDKPEVTVSVLMGTQRATLLVGAKRGRRPLRKRRQQRRRRHGGTDARQRSEEAGRRLSSEDVFEFKAYNAAHLEITRGSQKLVLDRVKGQGRNAEDTWKRTSPSAATPDKTKVEALLANLAALTITSFTDSTAKTGLDAPVMIVEAKIQDSPMEDKVTFGKSGDDVYVARQGDPVPARSTRRSSVTRRRTSTSC